MKTQEQKNKKTKKHKDENCFNVLMFSCFNDQTGQSLVEVLIALGVFVLGIATIGFLVLDANVSTRQGVERTQATLLAREGLEAARSIRDADFDNLTAGPHGIVLSGNKWIFSGTSDIQDQFTRSITIEDISAKEKKITSNISWQFSPQRSNSVSLVTYLNDWLALIAPTSCNEYAIQEGYISGTCRQNPQQCTNNGETYLLGGDVYCIGGPSEDTCCGLPLGGGFCSGTATACTAFNASPTCQAQAGCAWGGGVLGSTANSNFSSALDPWTYGSWGSVNPTISRATSGGNLDGYAKIQFPNTKSKVSGGYFEQSFTVTGIVSAAILNLDWIVSQYTGVAGSLTLYAFVDSSSGAPTIGQEVWSSGNRTDISGWATVSNINVSGKIIGAGTYYLKVATYLDYNNGGPNRQYATGFDNIILSWTTADTCSGAPAACDTFVEQSSCQAQSGCFWNGD